MNDWQSDWTTDSLVKLNSSNQEKGSYYEIAKCLSVRLSSWINQGTDISQDRQIFIVLSSEDISHQDQHISGDV